MFVYHNLLMLIFFEGFSGLASLCIPDILVKHLLGVGSEDC